jgi:integrase
MRAGRVSSSLVDKFLRVRTSQKLKASTLSRDISAIKFLMTLQKSNPTVERWLTFIAEALKRKEAQSPSVKTKKALPLSRAVLLQRCQTAPKATALALKLAFLAAARSGELIRLQPSAIQVDKRQSRIFLQWTVTKTNPRAETRPDHLQLLDISDPDFRDLRQLSHLEVCEQVLKVSRMALTQALNETRPSKQYVKAWQSQLPLASLRNRFTGHSLKRGRAAELWAQAAAGTIPIQEVMHVLKHKSLKSAMAYSPSPLLTARAIQRQQQFTALENPRDNTTRTRR